MRFRIHTVPVDLGAATMGEQKLTANEAGVLGELYKADGDTVSRLHLYKEVWGYTRMPRGRAVDFVVMRLRKKLESCGGPVDLIPTVRGRGFRLIRPDASASAQVATAPATPGAPAARHDPTVMELPVDVFVGRSTDLAELAASVEAHQLVTVTGPPGVGKSRLVLEFLAGAAQPYVAISTSDLASEREVRAKLGLALGAPADVPSGDVTARLAGGQMRTVFIDDADGIASQPLQAIPRWLRAAPDLRIIVTSGRPLGVRGERLLRLAPLPAADGRALFLQRAQEVDVDIPASDFAQVDRIIETLDSLPLAIELASSRLRALDIEGLEAALTQRFQVLRRRGSSSSLLGALEASWRSLSTDERAALERLCGLHGTFELDVASAALEGLDTYWIDLLESLVDNSLIQHLGDADGVFRTLWSVSDFVEQASEPDARAAARRHVASLLATRDWGARRLRDLLIAARWPDAAPHAEACRTRALRVALRTGRFGAAREALALGGAWTAADDIQALSLLTRLAGAPTATTLDSDAALDALVMNGLADTSACLRWSSSGAEETTREQLAAHLDAAARGISTSDWRSALVAFDDGMDLEGMGHDFGLVTLQLVRLLALGRTGRPIAAQYRELEALALEAQELGMTAVALSVLLLTARFHDGLTGIATPDDLDLDRIGLPPIGRAAIRSAWDLAVASAPGPTD